MVTDFLDNHTFVVMKNKIICLIIMSYIISGCGAMLGFKKVNDLNENSYVEFIQYFQIEDYPNFRINGDLFNKGLESITDSVLKKYVSQPLQIRVYDSNKRILFLL